MRRVLLLSVLVLVGCGSAQPSTTVFAASSLRSPFTKIEQLYEQQYPDEDLRFSFAGSADLVAQLEQGAPADVLATADAATMQKAGLPDPRAFASNTMVIVVPLGNPAGVTGIEDLADPALSVSVCAPQVPCGAATARIEQAAQVEIAADSEESAVTDVLGKVSSGQADAGIVYRSDLTTAGGVAGITIPAAINTTNDYFVAAVDESGEQFTRFLFSDAAQGVLREDGFRTP